jgi:type IV pilus biogenesis protein CpaD/CtpE
MGMGMSGYKILAVLGMLGLMLPVGACTLDEPDHFSASRVQVEEKPYTGTVDVSQFGEGEAAQAAAQYRRYGEGPVELVVTYDPVSARATAMSAADEAARLAQLLRRNGVENVRTNIMPVNDSGERMKALLSYNSYSALPPEDCTLLPGIENRANTPEEGYKMGCSVDTLYARQIARPRDLKGQTGPGEDGDGRRAANIVEVYRSGQPNKPLEGETASGEK